MNLKELKACLLTHPELNLLIALPDGRRVPSHYHVTEVGHIAKNFVDCGGTFRASEAVVLQTYFGSPKDDGHRLTAGRLTKILGLAKPILPTDEMPLEVEYEDGIVSQFPLVGVTVADGVLTLQLGYKHTDCLAKEKCGGGEDAGCDSKPEELATCCGASAGSQRCC